MWLAAVADSKTEHSEAVRILKSEGVDFSEDVFSYERDRRSLRRLFLFEKRKESVTKPLLLATIGHQASLRRLFDLYKSSLYFRDFLLLGTLADSPEQKAVLATIAQAKECDVPIELLNDNVYLMITAQEHGTYILTKKLSRTDVQETTTNVCSKHGVDVVVKELAGRGSHRVC